MLPAFSWWKVGVVDAIGACMGGPCGAVGASAISVVMQL
jgi:hypothetical protein